MLGNPMVRPTDRLETGTHVCAWWHPIFSQILTPNNALTRDRNDAETFVKLPGRGIAE